MMELADNPVAEFEDSLVQEPLSDILNAQDRCDQCGAQAFHWVQLTYSAGGMLFCHHHFQRNEVKLTPSITYHANESYKINKKPSPAAHD